MWDLVALDFAIQFVGFCIAAALQTEKFYDAAGTGTFFLLIVLNYSRSTQTQRSFLLTLMVSLWAIRLGIYFSNLLPRV
jgi:steroid 5-alpha reductase family enzyme